MPNYTDEHKAFAASRSSDYVYVPVNNVNFTTLDKHAETIEMESKLPLVLVGEPGIGKNALLSNWVKRRMATKHRDEFLFQYFAGASTRAKQLSHMLHKLEASLKEFFQLREMEVPSSEERLIWSLNRFLASAAKKHYPARIVIVVDGVFSIKGLDMPTGALHWLPTELPAGVSFIVSTITTTEKGGAHRTYLELIRRKCPVLMMEAITGECQEAIIKAFMKMHPNEIHFTKEQITRIIQLDAQSKPMYLRTLLYALRREVGLNPMTKASKCFEIENDSSASTRASITSGPGEDEGEEVNVKVPDESLYFYLSSKDSSSLTSKVLDMYAAYVDEGEMGEKIVGAVLSVMYAARSGLMDDEIWGAAEIYLGHKLSLENKHVLLLFLKDNTKLVQGERSFSHEEFRGVVYSKYIQSPENMVRLHIQMARYFAQLPASDRKVECQPYHLEAAGCWNKLKNCLVDIDMFGIWWTPAHKKEFTALWASLTNANNQIPSSSKKKPMATSECCSKTMTMEWRQTHRPCYDVVEEYNRSLDDFKDKVQPSDERVAMVILEIADFLLEFSSLGHEEAADTPQFVHPQIPNEDLASLGVQFLSTDKNGRSVLNRPHVSESKDGDKPLGVDQPPKPNEDFPNRTSYFYLRWMWIQFPWVALANCGEKYLGGIAQKGRTESLRNIGRVNIQDIRKPKKETLCSSAKPMGGVLSSSSSASDSNSNGSLRACASIEDNNGDGQAKLPWIATQLSPGNSSRSNTRKRVRKKCIGEGAGIDDNSLYWVNMKNYIQQEILDFRSELDAFSLKRMQMERKLKQVTDEANEIDGFARAREEGQNKIAQLLKKEEKLMTAHHHAKMLTKNYKCLVLMCERHPAHSQALVEELRIKLHQDDRLIKEAQKRFREETGERRAYQTDFTYLKRAIREKAALQQAMISNREKQHIILLKNIDFSTQLASQSLLSRSLDEGASSRRKKYYKTVGELQEHEGEVNHGGDFGGTREWEEAWALIRASTGIADPDLFIQKYLNCDQLEIELMKLKQVSETRFNDLKKDMIRLEEDLEQTRCDLLSIGGNKEARDVHERLNKAKGKLKRSKERSDATESLQRRTVSGLRHICELLGGSESEEDMNVSEMIGQLEFILDCLVDEKDRFAPKNRDGNGENALPMDVTEGGAVPRQGSTIDGASDGDSQLSLEISVSRPAEIEAALQQFVSPKVRIAQQLIDRRFGNEGDRGHTSPLFEIDSTSTDEESTGDMVPDREAVKAKSEKTFRSEQRKQARRLLRILDC